MAEMRSPKKQALDTDADFLKLEELLNSLTEEELEKLEEELIDPDDSNIPPSQRCRYKTKKAPTGPFNRKALLDYLEKKAKEEKDWDEVKPYVKEVRGKVWKPKEQEKIQINEDAEVETEWDEVLKAATEEELVDLAAVLGFHGMLNQLQYHQAFVDEGDKEKSGFQGIAKHQGFKTVPDEPPNTTDAEECLSKIQNNDPGLKEVNLNNIKNIPIPTLVKYGEALKTNTHLERLEMCNTRATDKVAKAIAEGLKDNKTLKILNLESNYISGDGILKIFESININLTMEEFRVANQRPQVLGNQVEMAITDFMEENPRILKLGIFLQAMDARARVQEYLQRNNDAERKRRKGELTGPLTVPKKERKEYKSRLDHAKIDKKTEESDEESETEDDEEE